MTAIARWHAITSEEALPDLEALLPTPHSLRRASEDSKAAVAAAAKVLADVPREERGRIGVYVGQQRGSLEYCQSFIDQTYRDGPRMASPLFFSESVANNAATHLSLTLGFTGVMATFIGTRVAGLQALLAAREDLEAGVTDSGLVVIQSFPTSLTSDAYNSLYRPHARRPAPPPFKTLRGSLALLLRKDAREGHALLYGGVRCAGRSLPAQVSALSSLWKEFRGAHAGPVQASFSAFCLAHPFSRKAFLESLGAESVDESSPRAESFALDPFLQVLGTSGGVKAVACLSEEGTAGLLVLEAA